MNEIKRGQVYYCDMSPVVGSEQGGLRPVVIVQNAVGNYYSPTTIVCPITSVMTKKPLPTHVTLKPLDCGLRQTSVVLAEHLRTVDKRRLKELIGKVPLAKMKEIDKALRISLEI